MARVNHHRFLGADERAFPRDFAVFIRYHFALLRAIPARHALDQLDLRDFDHFHHEHQHRYRVTWRDESQRMAA